MGLLGVCLASVKMSNNKTTYFMNATALLGLLTIIEGKSFICKCSPQWGQNILKFGSLFSIHSYQLCYGSSYFNLSKKSVFFHLLLLFFFTVSRKTFTFPISFVWCTFWLNFSEHWPAVIWRKKKLIPKVASFLQYQNPDWFNQSLWIMK